MKKMITQMEKEHHLFFQKSTSLVTRLVEVCFTVMNVPNVSLYWFPNSRLAPLTSPLSALGQLLALDISCNIEIIVGRPTDIPHPTHSRGKSDGAGLRFQRACSEDGAFSFNQSLGKSADGAERIKVSVEEEQPLLRRRHSFTSQRSVASSVTVQRAEESVQFIHELLSGVKFAGDRDRSKSLRPPIAVYTFGQVRNPMNSHAFDPLMYLTEYLV